MKKYDAIIIGFGKGGKTLAAGLAERNFTVAMIERSDKDVRRYVYQYRMYSDQDTDTFGRVGRYECVLGTEAGILPPVCCTEV